MKVRTGFVSNSSSTAFAICMTQENYCKVVNKLPIACKIRIMHVKVPKKTLGGVKMVLLGGHTGDEEDFMGEKPFRPGGPLGDHDNERELFGKFIKALKKQPHLDWQSWA
jgi:hypothetical protein